MIHHFLRLPAHQEALIKVYLIPKSTVNIMFFEKNNFKKTEPNATENCESKNYFEMCEGL